MRVWMDGQLERASVAHFAELDLLWKNMTRRLFSAGKLIRCVYIDGKPYYEGYEQVLQQQFPRIKEIQVVSMTLCEWFNETVSELAGSLVSLQDAAKKVRTSMYGSPSASDWQRFVQVLEGLRWVYEAVQAIVHYNQSSRERVNVKEWAEVFHLLETVVPQLAEALERKEPVTVGDILGYELEPVLQRIGELCSRVRT